MSKVEWDLPARQSLPPSGAAGHGVTSKRHSGRADSPPSDSPPVRFAVLGALQAWRGQEELDLGPRQQRSILALLLINSGQPVGLERIVATLWGDSPPSSAVNVIHKYVGVIRRVLEPELRPREGGRWLSRQSGGYRFDADEDTCDLLRFRSLRRSARKEEHDGDGGKALRLVIEALALWRGSCSTGLGLDPARQTAFNAIDRERLDASIQAADLALRHGGAELVLPLLRSSIQSDFLNEALQARYILLLAAAGQQAEAVSALQTIRTQLRHDLGIDPGSELREAQERVLRQQVPSFGSLAESSDDAVIEPATALDLPPIRPVVAPAELPQDLPAFAGRADELTETSTFIDGRISEAVAVVAIDGMAGIGKSTFAVRLAHRLAGDLPEAQLYLNLHGFSPDQTASLTSADALRYLLTALGAPAAAIPDSVEERSRLYRSLLAGKQAVVVLDNARDVEQVRPLLPGSPGALVIVTSRNSLAGLVATDGAHLVTLGLLSPAASREALVKRLGAERVEAEPEAADELIAQSGHLPLALAIIGARAAARPMFSLSALAAELRDIERSLDAFGITDSVISPRTVFSWSYRLLSDDAATLFRLLSQHPGMDVTVHSCANLVGTDFRRGRMLVAELAEASLILEHAPGRFTMHDLIQAYAKELCLSVDSADDRRQAFRRLFDFYLQSSYQAQTVLRPLREPIPPAPPRPGVTTGEVPTSYDLAMAWFAAERSVLNCLIEETATRHPDLPVWQIVIAMQQFYHWCGFLHDWWNSCTSALAAAESVDDLPGQGHVHRSLAGACWYLGKKEQALDHLRQAQEIYKNLGYTTEHAYIHLNLGEIYNNQNMPAEGKRNLEIALSLLQGVGNLRGIALAIKGIGFAQNMMGDFESATASLRRSAEIARSIDIPHEEADSLAHLGQVFSRTGRHDEAVSYIQRALDILRPVGHPVLEVQILRALARAYDRAGDSAAARDARLRADAISARLGLAAVGPDAGP
jgi:DNA-binding SARP family transcriptional activator